MTHTLVPNLNGEILDRVEIGCIRVSGIKVMPVIWTVANADRTELVRRVPDLGTSVRKRNAKTLANESVSRQETFLSGRTAEPPSS
jgi:hypothetical protein